jgi:hypothetical protein
VAIEKGRFEVTADIEGLGKHITTVISELTHPSITMMPTHLDPMCLKFHVAFLLLLLFLRSILLPLHTMPEKPMPMQKGMALLIESLHAQWSVLLSV